MALVSTISDDGLPLAGKVAAVTGATRGLGRELAIGLAGAGAEVIVIGRDATSGAETLDLIADAGGKAYLALANVADETAMARVAEEVATRHGGIDALVCAAGVSLPKGPVQAHGEAEFRHCFDTNVLGVALSLKSFLPQMIAREAGRIVVIGGTYGHKGVADHALYAASKWAVRGLVKSTALEVGRHGITANVVAPGGIDGERLRRLFRQSAERQGRQESEVLDDFLKSAALGRLVDGADIMAAVLHLLGPGGRNITGQDLVVDAGTII